MDQNPSGGFGRRTVVRGMGAAWAAPVIVAAGAAPAFAGSTPAPNLSTSPNPTTKPARHATTKTWIEIAPNSSTLVNSGGADALGLRLTYTSTVAINSIVAVFFGAEVDPTTRGVTFTGLGTTVVTMNVPPSEATITANGGTYSSGTRIRLKMASAAETTLQITVDPANGGTGKVFPATVIPA